MGDSLRKKSKSVLVELSRINEWAIISLSLALFAFLPHAFKVNEYSKPAESIIMVFTTPELYIALVVIFMAQIFLFSSNDYYDRHVDALDDKKKLRNPVCAGRVTEKQVKGLLFATAAISLVGSMYFGILPFVFTAFVLTVFFFYTAEPLRFKNKVGLDVLSHATLINSFPYIFCLIALSYFSPGVIYLLFVIMLRSAIAQLLQEIRDYEIDKKLETNTVIYLGQGRAMTLVLTLYMFLTIGTIEGLLAYQLFGIGLHPFYLLVLFISLGYSPIFYRLVTSENYAEIIEKQWMGQGRTNRQLGLSYGLPVGAYLFVVYFFII